MPCSGYSTLAGWISRTPAMATASSAWADIYRSSKLDDHLRRARFPLQRVEAAWLRAQPAGPARRRCCQPSGTIYRCARDVIFFNQSVDTLTQLQHFNRHIKITLRVKRQRFHAVAQTAAAKSCILGRKRCDPGIPG